MGCGLGDAGGVSAVFVRPVRRAGAGPGSGSARFADDVEPGGSTTGDGSGVGVAAGVGSGAATGADTGAGTAAAVRRAITKPTDVTETTNAATAAAMKRDAEDIANPLTRRPR